MPKESATNHSYIHTNTHTYTQTHIHTHKYPNTHTYKNTLKRQKLLGMKEKVKRKFLKLHKTKLLKLEGRLHFINQPPGP